jgi:hypothetical protein
MAIPAADVLPPPCGGADDAGHWRRQRHRKAEAQRGQNPTAGQYALGAEQQHDPISRKRHTGGRYRTLHLYKKYAIIVVLWRLSTTFRKIFGSKDCFFAHF